MKINKHTPNNDINSKLSERLNTPENEKYAKKLDNLDRGHYGKAVVKAMLSAAAVLIIAVAVGIFALVGRELWHSGTVAPASAPDRPNYIFIEGRYAGFVEDGKFSELLLTDHKYSFNEILSNDCFYDMSGNEITEIYINVNELKELNRDETQSIASRLKKYASGEYRNYYKFTLPVTMDEEILITGDVMDFAFSEDEIENRELLYQHKYVSAYKLQVKSLADFKSTLKTDEIQKINQATDCAIDSTTKGYTADIDGDGQNEKLVSIASDITYSGNAYSHVIVFDGDKTWFLHTAFQTMQGQEIDKRELAEIIDFDLDGSYEVVLQRPYKDSNITYVYKIIDGGANEVFTIFPWVTDDGITIREFAARVSYMALGTEYDPEYPSDEVCAWYMRLFQTENMNLDKLMNYNSIYYGIEGFADMYNITLDGWDRGSILEPLAESYDPSTTASRDKAEELMQKAADAFKNSKVSLDYTNANITKMTVNNTEIAEKTIIDYNLEVLKNIKVTDIEHIGGVTGIDNRVTLYNGDGYEVVSFSYDKGHFYMNECCYTVEGTPFENLNTGVFVIDN